VIIILIQKEWIPTINVHIQRYLDTPTCNLDLTRLECQDAASLKSDLANHMPEKEQRVRGELPLSELNKYRPKRLRVNT